MQLDLFLKTMYEGCNNGFISIWTLPDKRTNWFKSTDIKSAVSFATAQSRSKDVYYGVCLREKPLGSNQRGKNEDVSIVTALYADIDIKGPAHKETELPETQDEAVEFLNSLPIVPSIVVSSGNGFHAYWLLNEPYKISNEEDRNNISDILAGWQKYINNAAKEKGWRLDTVSDLARVLRLPGTLNHKNEESLVECNVIESSAARYVVGAFEKYKMTREAPTDRTEFKNIVCGSADRVLEKCGFISYCKEHAESLPEPYWHACISNIALANDGVSLAHEISKPYPKYNKAETDNKIKRAKHEDKPHTCEYIKDRLGFTGCREDCTAKAPIALSVLTKKDQMDELINEENLEPQKVFSKDYLSLAAYAKANLPAEYALLKMKLKGIVNLNDFEQAVKHISQSNVTIEVQEESTPIQLKGINLKGAVTPSNWNISIERGVRKNFTTKDGVEKSVIACPIPVVISKRFENIDDESEKVELAFYRNNRWKHVISPRSAVFNKNSLLGFADTGIPVNSGTASDLVEYLSDYEMENINVIPLMQSVSRVGWISDTEFFPYIDNKQICFESDSKEANDVYNNLSEKGDYFTWKEAVNNIRQNNIARFLIAASFASPLLERIGNRVFFIHIWHDSKSGKTATIKSGLAAWGNPLKLMGSFNATSVGMERMAGALKHLPFAIDELQVLNEKKIPVESIVYTLAQGSGRIRGAKNGGIQEVLSWRNIIITSGEQPITKDSSIDGVQSRTLEIYGRPIDNPKLATTLHQIADNNYGFAGSIYMKYIKKVTDSNPNSLEDALVKIKDRLKIAFADSVHLDNVAAVCLGDYYAELALWHSDPETAFEKAVQMGIQILKINNDMVRSDTTQRAWEFAAGWLVSNEGRFCKEAMPQYGVIDDKDDYWVIPQYFHKALEENGFNATKIIQGFKERGLIPIFVDSQGVKRSQKLKKINGKPVWVYKFVLPKVKIEGEIEPLI